VKTWRCVTCDKPVVTTHCPDCGESAVVTRDLGFRQLLIEAFHSITDVDSTLLRSFRALLFKPGTLTVAYLEGPRKPYLSPFQVFVIANVLFFAVQSAAPDKVFSNSLDSHLHGQDWSALARGMVARHLAAKQTTLEAYAPVFDHAVGVNARALVFVMGIPFAILLMLMLGRSARPFAAHIVFTLHFYAFQLLVLCALLLGLLAQHAFGGSGIPSPHMDTALFVLQLVLSAAYLYVAVGKVYGMRRLRRLAVVGALILTAGCAVLGYRFFIFVATLYGT
jgi:Protein of unknown function (DUF3667)